MIKRFFSSVNTMKSTRKWHLNVIYHSVSPTTGINFSLKSEFGKETFCKTWNWSYCLQKYCTEKPLLGRIERSDSSCCLCLCGIVIQGVQYWLQTGKMNYFLFSLSKLMLKTAGTHPRKAAGWVHLGCWQRGKSSPFVPVGFTVWLKPTQHCSNDLGHPGMVGIALERVRGAVRSMGTAGAQQTPRWKRSIRENPGWKGMERNEGSWSKTPIFGITVST